MLSSKIKRDCEERRAVMACGTDFAKKTAAEEYPFLPENAPDVWCKLVWYSDEVGGKLITFKCGCPYLPKEGKRKDGQNITEQEREAGRLAQSLSRTKRRIFEIAACNEWEWFFTGTLDESKANRFDLDDTFKKLAQFLRDHAAGCRYLIVPEQHKNGAWHFHGLLSGLPEKELHLFTTNDKLPYRILKMIRSGTGVYEWERYSERFGYTTLTRVRDSAAVSCYITKYITKELKQNAQREGYKHLYYCSRGLNKPICLAESSIGTTYLPIADFENDYVQVRKVATKDEARAIIKRYGLQMGGEQ